MGRKTYLITTFLIVSFLVVPIQGLQSSSQNISSEGMVVYPEHELGVFYVAEQSAVIPKEASWVVAALPDYVKTRENISVILDWYRVHHKPYGEGVFRTSEYIKTVESRLMDIPVENFWGLIFICEEVYRTQIVFNDDVNTTWFGKTLLGYPLYLAENPDATEDDWKDEMFLRMIQGFYNYFHEKTKVGITANGASIVTNWKNQSWSKGIPKYFGEPAMAFIKEHYDFVFLYAYTENLGNFHWTKQYFSIIDQLFQKQRKFWILTRIWEELGYTNIETWELEATALEIKNCIDRNMVLTCYYWNNPPLEETWALTRKAAGLYDGKTPYFENYIYGKNLLTGYVGNTYGWVEV